MRSIFHVDDILSAGDNFFESIMEKLRRKYTFGKVETKSFVFTGIRITQSDNMEVSADQADFSNKIGAGEYEVKSSDEILDMDENKTLRSLQGQLSWLCTQTRPDLSFDAFQLSTVLNRSTYKDAKHGNKVVKKMKETTKENCVNMLLLFNCFIICVFSFKSSTFCINPYC